MCFWVEGKFVGKVTGLLNGWSQLWLGGWIDELTFDIESQNKYISDKANVKIVSIGFSTMDQQIVVNNDQYY